MRTAVEAPAAAAVPPGFVDAVVIGGLNAPTAAAFAPDGRVFVAEKSGIVKVFDSLADPTATVFADLRTQTHDFWDRGLLGLAVDPQFPARPYVYVLYSHDAVPGGSAPRWGDACPTPPGPTDQDGAFGTTSVPVTVGNPPGENPVAMIDDPTSALRWRVGQSVPFAGRASDPQDGVLPASVLSWRLTLQHCATGGWCHAHVVQNLTGVATGSFVAPDHEYPSYLELTLTATDSTGRTGSTTVRLDPQTVVLSFTSNPSQAVLTVGGTSQRTPFGRTVIVGSGNSISAPSRVG